jgi:hypothetical protein
MRRPLFFLGTVLPNNKFAAAAALSQDTTHAFDVLLNYVHITCQTHYELSQASIKKSLSRVL